MSSTPPRVATNNNTFPSETTKIRASILQFKHTRSFTTMPRPSRSISMSSAWGPVARAARSITRRPASLFLGATLLGATAISFRSAWLSNINTNHKKLSTDSNPSVASSALNTNATAALPGNAPDQSTSSSKSSPFTPQFVLKAGAAMIPHPSKEEKGGEDAFFISPCGLYLGVADGVGGWAEIGVDPGLYSKELMAAAAAAAATVATVMTELDGRPGPDVPQKLMEIAHSVTMARGSCTACIVCLENNRLHASNLGDSGFLIVKGAAIEAVARNNKKENNNSNSSSNAADNDEDTSAAAAPEEFGYMSPQQQHEFNFPYQIGSADSMSDSPSAAQRFTIDVHPGDVIILATDGLFDNVYPEEAANIVAEAKGKGMNPEQAAASLAQYARVKAADPSHLSPFAYGAQQLGYRFFGGKMDDITVVCAYVAESDVLLKSKL